MGIFNEDVEVREITVGKIDDGQKFIASTGRAEVADDASTTLFVENPTGNDQDAFISVSYLPSGDSEVEVSTDVAQDGTGSALTVISAKPVGGGTPDVNVRSGDSYTVNGDTIAFNTPGGSNAGVGVGGGSEQTAPTTFLLEQGVSMLFEMFNRSGGTSAVGFGVSWFEVDL